MLTITILKDNIQGLTDEQLSKIAEMSKNDENDVIGKKFGEVYKRMDETIEAATGIKRAGDEKTYNYLERAAKELKDKLSDTPLKHQNDDLLKEIERLKKLSTGEDSDLQKQVETLNEKLKNREKAFKSLQDQYKEAEESHKMEIQQIRINDYIDEAAKTLKFKSGTSEALTQMAIQNAVRNITTNYKPEMVQDETGKNKLVFKDAEGNILNNPKNLQNPFTAQEMLKNELSSFGILDEGRKIPGGGTQPPLKRLPDGSVLVDVAGAKNQSEADDIISKALMAQGLAKGTEEYRTAYTQAWNDNEVDKMPTDF